MAFPFFGNLGNLEQFEGASSSTTSFASGARSNQDVVFVDVGSRKIDSRIVRDGVSIGVHTTNPDVFDDIIVTKPAVRLTVVSQSIAAGTAVPVGAAIDIVMARPGILPIGLLQGVLTPLSELTIGEGFTRFVSSKPQVRRILARASTGTLSGEDEQAVRDLFESEQVPLTDQPGHDVDAAVETLRVLSTFGG